MTPEIAGMRIARSIKSVENDVDELLAKACDLLAEMARARVATANPAAEGQIAMVRVAAMQKNLLDARSELVKAHKDLSRLAETMDIPVSCPENGQLESDAAIAQDAGVAA